jgi:DNA polymerase III alpha subunit
VVHRAPSTAKGHHFVTLEDERGLINVIVRPKVYIRYRRILHTARLLIVEGVVQQKGGVTNLVAWRVGLMHHLRNPPRFLSLTSGSSFAILTGTPTAYGPVQSIARFEVRTSGKRVRGL